MMVFNVNMCVIHIINTRKHKNSEFVCTELINLFCGAKVTCCAFILKGMKLYWHACALTSGIFNRKINQ